MTRNEILSKIIKILNSEIGPLNVVLSESSKSYEVTGWDSLAHTRIMMAIEEDFSISIDIQGTYAFSNIGGLITYIQSLLPQ